MNGYYKWDRETKSRRPFYIQYSHGQLLFALGVWERWGEDLDSFSILTFANPNIPLPLTQDGPVFVGTKFSRWLSDSCRSSALWAKRIKQPLLEAYPVTRQVANRKRDDYTLLEPVYVEPGHSSEDE